MLIMKGGYIIFDSVVIEHDGLEGDDCAASTTTTASYSTEHPATETFMTEATIPDSDETSTFSFSTTEETTDQTTTWG